ncbi:MAG: hypothetical protein KTR31_37525 [Myxococcales bacterium]|nr:hypothetical protein [Myxococcales bacterium]
MQNPDEAVDVACRSCHRLERWGSSDAPEVLTPGGARRTAMPVLAAWETVRACLEGEGRVVGACEACAQPLVAPSSSALAPHPWPFDTPEGVLTFDGVGALSDAEGSVSIERADERIRRANPTLPFWKRVRPGRDLFQATVLTLMLGPLLVFVLALMSLSLFVRPAVKEWRELLQSVATALGLM